MRHHFVVTVNLNEASAIVFTPTQCHQIVRVLRLRGGDEVVALDGRGAQYRVRLVMEGSGVRGEIIGVAADCREPRLRVTLLAAPPKGERWEWLLQKGTEIGVARFVPLAARYSQPGSTTVKPRHHEIVREATEQCRRLLLPEIAEPCSLPVALRDAAEADEALAVLLWEGVPDVSLAEVVRPALDQGCRDVYLFIGPEGGFHADEVALARELSIAVAGLGPLILRTETAGLVAAALTLGNSSH